MFNQEHWLTTKEQNETIELLLRFGIIKYDNSRSLPLKSGGYTDIYINMRDARSHPEVIAHLTRIYANALRRMDADRFIEVPAAVSCIAGPISVEMGIPFITIREEVKTGRVTKGKMIGDYQFGDNTVIIDDVITDGASKIVPYREGIHVGLDIRELLVLVDRQQGWESTFKDEDIPLNVWSGMTLHDVRKYLVTKGLLERSSKDREDNNPIIVAYDRKTWPEILPIAEKLRTSGTILKINDFFFEHGMQAIDELSVYGRVMLDGKFHDIPNTVANTCRRLGKHAPWAVTVHGSGGEEMVRAAVQALEGVDTKVLVITVLTSFDDKTCQEVYHRLPWSQAKALAKIAYEAGAHGFVCSSKEVGRLRKLYPEITLVVPGSRSPGADKGDQKRVATPAKTIADGADHLVMGRQIFGASDPVAEVERVVTKELERTW